MPIYEYSCPDCGLFEANAPMASYKQPQACPHCSASAARTISAPQLNLMASGTRKAHATNERSAHAPRMARSSCCAGGTCSHHKSQAQKTALKEGAPPPLKMQTGVRRPWQISH